MSYQKALNIRQLKILNRMVHIVKLSRKITKHKKSEVVKLAKKLTNEVILNFKCVLIFKVNTGYLNLLVISISL